jgi:hypothetical protein
MKHHYSIWVEDRTSDEPCFDRIPPLFIEYKAFTILWKAFFINLGMVLGSVFPVVGILCCFLLVWCNRSAFWPYQPPCASNVQAGG